MTSVLNRLRLLSGNKIASLLVLLMLALVVTACSGSKNASRSTKAKTKTARSTKSAEVTKVQKKDKVKEIEWKEGKDEKRPPIKNPEVMKLADVEILKEDVYDITYFVPFDAGTYANSASVSDRFVQYYSGLLVATEILEREGINLRINVVDEKKRNFEDILRSSVSSETDVIVGPYDKNDITVAAEWCKDNQIPLVSPWLASNKITIDNPFYVQLRPSLDEHYYAILNHIKNEYKDLSSVYLIGNKNSPQDNDKKRIAKVQKMAMDVWGVSDDNHLQEFYTIKDSIDLGETAFDSIFVADQPNVIIIPNWSTADEEFIYGALRRLSVEKGLTDVTVYGMPIMIESEKINFDYYHSLNMRVARSKFVDEADNDVRRFKGDFLSKYGALPSDDAYEGYDNLMYIGRNIYKYGKNFQFFLNRDQGYYLQAKYNVEPTRENSTNDNMKDINYFENKNVDIIEFKNNRFTRNLD